MTKLNYEQMSKDLTNPPMSIVEILAELATNTPSFIKSITPCFP
jgi:hypothetical protein